MYVPVVFIQQLQQHAVAAKKENPADLAEVSVIVLLNWEHQFID